MYYKYFLFILTFSIISIFSIAQSSSSDVTYLNSISENLQAPIRLAVDNINNIYVSDADNNTVEKYDASGNYLETMIISGSPISVAVNNDNQIFVGKEDGTIMKIETDGSIFTFYTDEIYPSAMDFNSFGDLYIADSKQNRVIVLDSEANQILSFGVGVLISPTSIAVDSRNQRILVGEHGGKEGGSFGDAPCDVKIFDYSGNQIGSIGNGGDADGEFYRIQGIDIGKCGNIYVNDPFQGNISVFDENLNYVTKFGVFGDAPSEFNLPMDVIFDHEERIIVTSSNNSRVEIFDVLNTLPTSNIQFSDASICGGETTDISFDFTGTAPWTFTYTVDGLNPIEITTSDNPYTLTVSVGGIYEVTGLSDASSIGTCFTGSAEVKVSQMPSAAITTIDETICEGEEVNIEIALAGSAPWEFTYTKDGLNPKTISTSDPNYILPVSETGLYEITNLISKACVATNTTGSAHVIVNPKPSSVFLEGHSTLEICSGDTIPLHADFTGTGPWTFTYTINDLNPVEVTTSNSQYILEAFESGFYEVKEISDLNCTANWTDTYPEVVVNERPTAEIANTDFGFCVGDHIQIPISFTGKPPFSYTYSYNNASKVTFSDVYYSSSNITAYQAGVYELISVSDKYCDAENITGQSNVVISPKPSVTFLEGNEIFDICQDESFDLHLEFTGIPPYSFTYTQDDLYPTTVSNILTNNYTLAVDSGGTYEIIEVASNSCIGTVTNTYPTVNVLDRPTALMKNIDSTICKGNSIQIPINFTGTAPFNFSYSINNDSIVTFTDIYENTYNINANQTGVYELVTTSDMYCDATQLLGQSNITEDPLPSAAFTYTDTSLDVYFINNSFFADSYLWNFGDEQTSTELNPEHRYISSGSYIVSLTATNSCGIHVITDTLEVSLALSNQSFVSESFKIYPNPSDGKIYLELGHLENEKISIEVIDIRGKIVKKESLLNDVERNFIDLSNLPAGIYFIKLIENNKIRTAKLIIQK